MFKKVVGFMIFALGAVVLVVSMTADITWIGDKEGFGWLQLLGSAIGFFAVPLGVWLALEKPRSIKKMGIVLIPLGLFVMIVSLAADGMVAADGIAIGDRQGIRWFQMLGAMIGFVVNLLGFWLALGKTDEKK